MTERIDGLVENGIKSPRKRKSHGEEERALDLQEPHVLCEHRAVGEKCRFAREEAMASVVPKSWIPRAQLE